MTDRISPTAMALLLVAALAATTAAAQESERFRYDHDAVPGEYIVKYRDGAPAAVRGMRGLSVAETVKDLPSLNAAVVRLPDATGMRGGGDDVTALAADPAIAYVEPDYLYYATDASGDPLLPKMWFLNRIEAFKGWNIRAESPEVVVAVIDTGIFTGHEDLAGHAWVNRQEIPGNGVDDDGNGYIDDVNGWDFHAGDNDPTADFVALPTKGCRPHASKRRYEYHGTHVAATIGAVGGNGRGVVGITRRVKIMALKVLGGPCGAGPTSNIIQAVEYAIRNRAHILNLSLGGANRSRILEEMLRRAVESGIMVIAAAGNNGRDTDRKRHYPAGYRMPGLMAVAATGTDDRLARRSNYGIDSVQIAAPGVKILSAVPTGNNARRPRSGYRALSGTSMAAPIVAGAAALVKSQFPHLSNVEVLQRLLDTADRLPSLRGKVMRAARLNLYRALAAPLAAAPPPPKPKPKPAPVVKAPPKPKPPPVAVTPPKPKPPPVAAVPPKPKPAPVAAAPRQPPPAKKPAEPKEPKEPEVENIGGIRIFNKK